MHADFSDPMPAEYTRNDLAGEDPLSDKSNSSSPLWTLHDPRTRNPPIAIGLLPGVNRKISVSVFHYERSKTMNAFNEPGCL